MPPAYEGIMFVGDPHLASRIPGFRKDEYPNTVLGKLDWCLGAARQRGLIPVLLGDIFHYPRDNANWLVVEVLQMLAPHGGEVLALTGNHDCFENELTPHDTLSILSNAGHLTLLDAAGPWQGVVGGAQVVIGGTAWNQPVIDRYERPDGTDWVFWANHHDIALSPEREGRYRPREIPGVDVVVNGHIHTPYEPVTCGRTTWFNPGNIARVNRGDSTRTRIPSALSVSVSPVGWTHEIVEVPHRAFEDVFHAEVLGPEAEPGAGLSGFVKGLAQLEALRTESGAGLKDFLQENLREVDARVAGYVWELAKEFIDEK